MNMPLDNNSDKVISQLMNVETTSLQRNVQLRHTGAFQSRTVTVNGEECKIQELITKLGERINSADVDEPDLRKLKAMLTAVSVAEVENRSATSRLFHLFSSRDKDVAQLSSIADAKIAEKALEHGVDVPLNGDPFPNFLRRLYGEGQDIKYDIRISSPIYLTEKGYSLVDSGMRKVQFYMQPEDITGLNPKYKLALTDPNPGLQDVIDHLANMNIKEEI